MKAKLLYAQKVTFPDDFADTYNLFLEIIQWDTDIKGTVDEKNLYKGLFSPAIRVLIQRYVDKKKPGFIEFKKSRIYADKLRSLGKK